MYVKVDQVTKGYGSDEGYMQALSGVSTEIDKGDICVILGASGSGKSTLLNMIGGLDTVDDGQILIDGEDITQLKSKKLVEYRKELLGFIFQFYNLIGNLTVRENIEVCRYLSKKPLNTDELISALGLKQHAKKFPSQISGGQQQRCAIARSLVKNPKLLLCDEPTGALDSKTAKEILILLEKVNREYGTTMLIVTHHEAIKNMADKVIRMRDGKILEEYDNPRRTSAEELEL